MDNETMDFIDSKDFIEVSDEDIGNVDLSNFAISVYPLNIETCTFLSEFLRVDNMDNEITVRPYKAEDALVLMEDLNEPGLKGQSDCERWAKLNETEGPGYTALYQDRIIGCGGIRIFWEGCGEAWIVLPKDIGQFHIDPQIVKVELSKMIKENNLQRVEISPACNWVPGLSYARWLGFKVEGKRRKYLPGNNGELVDCYLMAIIKD